VWIVETSREYNGIKMHEKRTVSVGGKILEDAKGMPFRIRWN